MNAAYVQSSHSVPTTTAPKARRAGYVLSALAVLFLLFDATIKVLQLPMAVQGTVQLGFPASVLFGLGVVQLICLAVYLFPRTSVLGAVLWTGYLGGAIATHVRVGDPLFSHVLFPVYVAALLWGGLWLRDGQLRAVLPVRKIN
jgi:DoxX-like family